MMRNQFDADQIIDNNQFRDYSYNIIPDGAWRILDFGCNQGELLLRLKRDKNCREVYGVEINESCRPMLQEHLDGSWIMNLEEENADLGQKFYGFFNYIFLNDVVEHLYDPWYTVTKLRRYLSPSGRLIIVTPNFQYWEFLQLMLAGKFQYGMGSGLLNEEHIRWFSIITLDELARLCGLEVESIDLLFPPGTDLAAVEQQELITKLCLPPTETNHLQAASTTINFPTNMRPVYKVFLANKLQMICRPGPIAFAPQKVRVGHLAKLRAERL